MDFSLPYRRGKTHRISSSINWIMKAYIPLILCILTFCSSFGQTPQGFLYQAVARDNSSNPLISTNIGIRISLAQGAPDNEPLYSETHNVTTTELGIFTIIIGQGETAVDNFDIIDWSQGPFFTLIEIDPTGGTDYDMVGSSRLFSVPYALYSETSADSYWEQLPSGWLSHDEPVLVDPRIQIQDGEFLGLSLNAANFPSITLFSKTGNGSTVLGTGGLYMRNDSNQLAVYLDFNLDGTRFRLSDPDGVDRVGLSSFGSGQISIFNDDFRRVVDLSERFDAGLLQITESTGLPLVELNAFDGTGSVRVEKMQQIQVALLSSNDMGGWLDLFSADGSNLITATGNNAGFGTLTTFNSTNQQSLVELTANEGIGVVRTLGPNGNLNTILTSINNNRNSGAVAVFDENGDDQAAMLVDANGNGIIQADMKNFVTDHPSDPSREIVYASLEGPEAAAYLRGTSELMQGKATVNFPEHFRHIILEESMTILLTPLSGSSKGLAVIEKSGKGFIVQELLEGAGTYEFDWEVKGVRSGFENYEVIRERGSIRRADRNR
jgi:hypothetical protein